MKAATEKRNIDAALDLPANHVAKAAEWAAHLRHLTTAELIALTSRIARSREVAARARASHSSPALDGLDQQLRVRWGAVEGELKRRLGG